MVVGTAPDCSLRMATMKERMKVKGKKAEIFENRDGRNQEKGGERQGETEGPVRIFREGLNKKCRMVQTSPKEAAAILRDFIQDDNWDQSHEKELKP